MCVFPRIHAHTFLQAGVCSAEIRHILVTHFPQTQQPRGFQGGLILVRPAEVLDILQNQNLEVQ